MLELIKRIDVPQTGEGEIHVLPLQHADATELTKTLNEIITGAATRAAPRRRRPAGAAPARGDAPPTSIFEGGVKVIGRQGDELARHHLVAPRLRLAPHRHRSLDQPRRQVFIEAVIMDLS